MPARSGPADHKCGAPWSSCGCLRFPVPLRSISGTHNRVRTTGGDGRKTGQRNSLRSSCASFKSGHTTQALRANGSNTGGAR
jgi:hypothetical protein